MIIGIAKETFPGERRVALIPAALAALLKEGNEVVVEAGAGAAAGIKDTAYRDKGARVVESRAEVFAAAGVILQVRGLGANREAGRADLELMRRGQIVIGFLDPLVAPEAAQELAERGADAFSMELMPRITRAQSMDSLSSMATIAGYKAVLLAADALPRMFPMMMTAAGTITPTRVFVLGAGVAGLQAIATAHRLGAVVHAYDLRPAVKEQVESLGAKFVELPLEVSDAEDKGGYARAQDEEFYRRQREVMARVVSESDVVITTAVVPGRKAPVLVTADMVESMAPGSVIVDLAAEQGGNCELTRANETTEVQGVAVMGPTNVASMVPYHASQMYAKNVSTFLLHLLAEDRLQPDTDDEIAVQTRLTRDGEVVHPRLREALGLAAPTPAP